MIVALLEHTGEGVVQRRGRLGVREGDRGPAI